MSLIVAPIQTLVIPKYITKVKLSERRQAKYYRESQKAKVPKKFRGKGFVFRQGFLYGPDGQRVVANPKVAGTPRWETVSGNKLSTGYGSPHIRNTITNALKDFFRPYVRTLQPFRDEHYPLRVEWDLYTTVDRSNFDLSNLWFYYKYFEDSLHESSNPVTGQAFDPILKDDSVQYLTHSPGPRLIPVDDFEDRCFVFRFYRDSRQELLTHDVWKQFNTPLRKVA
jgi:hypothetical protein